MLFLILVSLAISIAAYLRSGRSNELLQRIAALELELRELRKTLSKPADPVRTEPLIKVQTAAPVVAAKTEPPVFQKPRAPEAKAPAASSINWEQFMGAKLFAWIGGFALFLGIVFFVKYSFERNFISLQMRVVIGFITGLGLVGGGIRMQRKLVYRVTSHTLCATGIVVLYACSYAARVLGLLGALETFGLMSATTAAAFILAVRMNAQVVALLGIVGGFLTPLLLSTGHDNPSGLFGYIALLDIGLLAVALHRRWHYLTLLGAAGTILTQFAWSARFFVPGKYFEGNRVLVPMTILTGFIALFLLTQLVAKRRRQINDFLTLGTLALAGVATGFALFFLFFPLLAARPGLVFGYLFLIDLAVLATVFLDERRVAMQPVFGAAIFLILAFWTNASLTPALLNTALGFYLLFALFHSVAPIVLRRSGKGMVPGGWTHIFSMISLLMVLMPLWKSMEVSFAIWPFVFLVDLLAILVAVLTATLVPILLVLLITLVVLGTWIGRIPMTLEGLPLSLVLLGGFAAFFLFAGVIAARVLARSARGTIPPVFVSGSFSMPEAIEALLPASACVLPFLLLMMVSARLPVTDPSPVFTLAMILGVLLLGTTRILRMQVLPLCGLFATATLEYTWHLQHFNPAAAALPLGWYLAFYFFYTLYPFILEPAHEKPGLPWTAAALAGPVHFYLILRLVRSAWPNEVMGLLPATFAILSFVGFLFLARRIPKEYYADTSALAWFGGVTLFFVTLVFPIQFDHEWVTIGWALEGAALCWLFGRIAHPGLRIVGISLLVAAFVRLALNPAVLDYHPRSNVVIFNWYLYAYGIVCVALFAGARLLASPQVKGMTASSLLQGLGTILAFLLINLEIADFFTPPDSLVVTLQFSGNLPRDMSYSIAWALFALMLVIIGMRRKLAPVRYAGSGLLGVTILKLFLHDTSQLDDLYRIGAFILVALVAIVAAFLYQRFIAANSTSTTEPASPTAPAFPSLPDQD